MSLLSRRAARREPVAGNRAAPREVLSPNSPPNDPAWPGEMVGGRKRGVFLTCANPHCRSGWLQLWGSRATVFEGGWCCSEACVLERVQSALGREMDGRGSAIETHRHRIPLGLAMLEQGWITETDLRKALTAQRAAGTGKLGWWLKQQHSASEGLVTRALGLQWGCPVLGMEFHKPDGLTALVPRFFVDAFGALPLRVAAGRILYLGFEDRLDAALALAIERMTGLRVESGLVEESQFRPAHRRMLEADFPPAELAEAATEPALAMVLARALEKAGAVEARLARVHECLWMRIWLRPQTRPLPELGSVLDLIGMAAGQ